MFRKKTKWVAFLSYFHFCSYNFHTSQFFTIRCSSPKNVVFSSIIWWKCLFSDISQLFLMTLIFGVSFKIPLNRHFEVFLQKTGSSFVLSEAYQEKQLRTAGLIYAFKTSFSVHVKIICLRANSIKTFFLITLNFFKCFSRSIWKTIYLTISILAV